MANQDVRVSALNSTSSLSKLDLFLATVVDELSATGYTSKKITAEDVAAALLEQYTYADLQTTAKTIIAAINEAAESGGGRLDIEYDDDLETFNVTADEVTDALDNGFMLTFISDAIADGFVYILANVYEDGDNITLFFNKTLIAGNGTGQLNDCEIDQVILTVDTANDIITFDGHEFVSGLSETNDSITTPHNNWSATKIDTAIKQAIYNILPTRSASGEIASFTDGAENMPIVDGVFGIIAQQASGTPTPSSPLPITGFTGMKITAAGGDAWDEEVELGSINSNGELVPSSTTVRCKNPIPVKPNENYYFLSVSGTSETKFGFVYFYDQNLNFISSWSSEARVYDTQITTPNNCYYMRFRMASSYGTKYNNDIFIYHPTNTYAVDWTTEAGTVYGGTFDSVTGVLTVTHIKRSLDTLNWTLQSINQYDIANFRTQLSDVVTGVQNRRITNRFTAQTSLISVTQDEGFLLNASKELFIRINKSRAETEAQFESWLESNETYIVYELATPVEIQLSPVEINTLLGANNIWCDTGDSTVNYKADIGLLISELEAVGGNRSLSLSKSAPEEVKEEKSEEKEQEAEK